MPLSTHSTSLSITNPLVLYRSLLNTQRIHPDPAQHRLALHLQALYIRLKDYEPIAQYGYRLQQLHRTLGSTPANPAPGTNHGAPRQGLLSSLFDSKVKEDSSENLALTKVLTSHESAMQMDSPKGLLLHGEVGTGKSMLVDLFADCLPNRKKRRWHYNTFMLEIMSKLERLRRSRELIVPSSLGEEDDYSLLWLARELISSSPILFVDEFQLPDRAAAKILTNLMTCFFQLGGVLIATSNRMPEELDRAAGMHFTPPPSKGGFKGLVWGSRNSDTQRRRGEFADFLDVLRARCDVWQIEGKKDYRRLVSANSRPPSAGDQDSNRNLLSFQGIETLSPGNMGLGWEQSTSTATSSTENLPVSSTLPPPSASTGLPQFFFITKDSYTSTIVSDVLKQADVQNLSWASQRLTVYSRPLQVPKAYRGIAQFSFSELCSGALGPSSVLGPADYITLASNYHTIILTDVPVLSVLQKNEARRFITLLDALYEARCKLAIAADAGPDNLFFPEIASPATSRGSEESIRQDATYSETLSEIYQDATAPFRPNVSGYADGDSRSAPPDEPDATHARFAGLFDEDRAGRQKDLSSRHNASRVDVGDARLLARQEPLGTSDTTANMSADTETGNAFARSRSGPDFSVGAAFTGEDEKFAFKRAQSRLWELCSSKWWAREHESTSTDSDSISEERLSRPSWWRPLNLSVRVWERPAADAQVDSPKTHSAGVTMDRDTVEGVGYARSIGEDRDPVLFKHGATSPFRSTSEPPPKLSWTHVWGMMKWGKKAGRWGEGVDALANNKGEDSAMPADESHDDYIHRRDAWRKRRGYESPRNRKA